MEELKEKYKSRLNDFEKSKDGLESMMEGNELGLQMGNMYYILLMDIVRDLSK